MDIKVEVKKAKGVFWDLRVEVDCGVGRKWSVVTKLGVTGKKSNGLILGEVVKMLDFVKKDVEKEEE